MNACTVRSAPSVSSASAPRSAIRSCATRDSLRSRRANTTSGTTTNGTTAATTPASSGDVTTSMANAPTSNSAERNHCDSADPASACNTAVSACKRDSTSPVRAVSNQAGDNAITWSNTARRKSAPTRSPSHVTSAKRDPVASASSTMIRLMPNAVAFSCAWLPLANPPSISRRNPWPSASTSPADASSAPVAPTAAQRYRATNGQISRSAPVRDTIGPCTS